MTRREFYMPIIAKIIADVGKSDMAKLRKALREGFPYPPRSMHPYKIWLDEIRVQLGTKNKQKDVEGQGSLFNAST